MPDEEANGEDASNPPPSDNEAVFEDLKAYDNPEVFTDHSLPQVYKFRICHPKMSGRPTVVRVEIDGDTLPDILIESFFALISQDPERVKELCRQHGDRDFAEFRANTERDPMFDDAVDVLWLFFIRHFPKLALDIYHITILSAVTALTLSKWREQPDDRLGEVEVLSRSTLEAMVSSLEKDIKRMVETRPTGRPLGSGKSAERRAQEAAVFEVEVEDTIRTLLSTAGKMPTKTAVAKALGIGGLNPKTGIDSSLAAFRNKLTRLNVDYNAIVERVKLNN